MPKLCELEYYSATTDLWTSRATHPYLSYTVHFIDGNWELKSICLESIPLFEGLILVNLLLILQQTGSCPQKN